ncbi:MAG TPA: PAS domain S-box protein, partial [Planctomycetota bacterium]|nr:PAS domain S-box protein [Planctomycetota bacterium]
MQELPRTYLYALEHVADSVIVTDPASVIQYVNPAFTRITGYSREEVIGRKPGVQGAPQTTSARYREIWESILSRGWWSGQILNRRRSGEEWTARLTISEITDEEGRKLGYVGVAGDITEILRLQDRLKDAGLEAIHMLAVACEAKDRTTGNHVARVRHYACHTALKLGLSEREAEEIGYSSIMHDVGKLHVPDGILMKPGPLSEGEWREMRTHPAAGVRILRQSDFYKVARDIADNHHERWDGTGYPHGRRGR